MKKAQDIETVSNIPSLMVLYKKSFYFTRSMYLSMSMACIEP